MRWYVKAQTNSSEDDRLSKALVRSIYELMFMSKDDWIYPMLLKISKDNIDELKCIKKRWQ